MEIWKRLIVCFGLMAPAIRDETGHFPLVNDGRRRGLMFCGDNDGIPIIPCALVLCTRHSGDSRLQSWVNKGS